MPNQIRDLYYQLFNTLSASRKKNQLETELHEKQDLIVDTLNNAFTYEELHKALKEKTAQYFEDAKNSQPENSTIFMIKDYISRNYMNDTLSVKDISGHVYLSASYVCTFFKSETGQTLNQYLTEYRMEKAKQLLSDPKYKISEISSKVGYTDGNYFGKSFKKYSGFSPSEVPGEKCHEGPLAPFQKRLPEFKPADKIHHCPDQHCGNSCLSYRLSFLWTTL